MKIDGSEKWFEKWYIIYINEYKIIIVELLASSSSYPTYWSYCLCPGLI